MPGVPGAPDLYRVWGVLRSGGPQADWSAWSPADPYTPDTLWRADAPDLPSQPFGRL